MRKLKNVSISFLASAMLISGCGVLSDPVSLIKAPQSVHAQNVNAKSLQAIASSFLPANARLVTADLPIDASPVKQYDFDQDGVFELLVTYEIKGKPNETQIMILKEEKKKWKKIWEQKGLGYEFKYVGFDDITGDGQEELLIGWTIGASAGNILDVYTWKDNKLTKLTTESIPYHKFELFEIINTTQQEKQVRLATWQRDTGEAYIVDVLKWNSEKMVSDPDSYSIYFPGVVKFYQEKVKQDPSFGFYWYYLADAQLKTNHYKAAIESARKGIELNSGYPDLLRFQQLVEEATRKLEISLAESSGYHNEKFHFTLEFPKEYRVQAVLEENNQGSKEKPVLAVYHNAKGDKGLLFSIHVFPDYIWNEYEGNSLFKEIGKAHGYVYAMLTSSEHPYANAEGSDQYKSYNKLISQLGQITDSFKVNPPTIKKDETERISKFVQQAVKSFYYVMSGGSEEIETFMKDENQYRYLSSDLDSTEKLTNYLTKTFTSEAVKSFLEQTAFINHQGRLAQPNADGGSIINWGKVSITLIQENDYSKVYRCNVSLGDSFDTVTIEIEFKKEAEGWKLNTNPFDLT